jgi:hypothetical protein
VCATGPHLLYRPEGEERGIGSRREKNKWEGLGSYRYETSREKEKDD